ncbi:MAG: hypothetical protein L3J46_00525 [Kangiellaceae bacterium]|nr:hypothetical protein [Kangiellaceae bacterium]
MQVLNSTNKEAYLRAIIHKRNIVTNIIPEKYGCLAYVDFHIQHFYYLHSQTKDDRACSSENYQIHALGRR